MPRQNNTRIAIDRALLGQKANVLWAVLLGFATISLTACFNSQEGFLFRCEDRVKLERVSPDREWIATVFERDCGATTDFASLVNLRESNQTFDPDDGSNIFVAEGRPPIHLTWESNQQLLVNVNAIEIYRQDVFWNDIRITYQALSSTAE